MSTPSTTGPSENGAVRIAVNTMRARLTLLGFNLAVATFQLSGLPRRTGGAVVPGLEGTVHISPATALLLAIALSFAAMVAFVASGRLDERGDCTHWSLLLGDVLMYLAMAQSVAGLFEAMLRDIVVAQGASTATAASFHDLHAVLALAGGVAWLGATYVGPIVSLVRSPFGRPATAGIGAVYVALLVLLAGVWSLAGETQIELGIDGETRTWLGGLAAPLSW